jgi:hypothetical protein
MKAFLLTATALIAATPAFAAPHDADAKLPAATFTAAKSALPAQLDPAQRAGYRQVFASIHAGQWADAQIELDAMKPGPLHAIARAELYTAKGSPKIDRDSLVALLAQAPELPEADQLAALAKRRGASDADLPAIPEEQKLNWIPGAPTRIHLTTSASDAAAQQLAVAMQPYIKDDNGVAAQALLESTPGLSGDALTEWQARVAWIYYLSGDDTNARTMAAKSAGAPSDWGAQANWTVGLAAWRQRDCAAAASAFLTVATRATDVDLRAAGLYWASRANMMCGRPDLIEGELTSAAQYKESFSGSRRRPRRRAAAGTNGSSSRVSPTSASRRRFPRSARPSSPTR